jgi:hypothetical protein
MTICASRGTSRVQHGAEDAQAGGDAHRLVDDRLDDQVGRLLRATASARCS